MISGVRSERAALKKLTGFSSFSRYCDNFLEIKNSGEDFSSLYLLRNNINGTIIAALVMYYHQCGAK